MQARKSRTIKLINSQVNSSTIITLPFYLVFLVVISACSASLEKQNGENLDVQKKQKLDLIDSSKPEATEIANLHNHLLSVIVREESGTNKRQRYYVQSGFVLDNSEGYVATALGNLGNSKEFTVRFFNSGELLSASFIGQDKPSGLTILKINPKSLQNLKPLTHASAIVGKTAHILFRPESDRVVSREINKVDCSILDPFCNKLYQFIFINKLEDLHSYGAMVVDTNYRPIGILTKTIAKKEDRSDQLYSVLSYEDILYITRQFKQYSGELYSYGIGLLLQDITQEIVDVFEFKEAAGVMIADVMPQSPAMEAGLQKGDIILSVNSQKVITLSHLLRLLHQPYSSNKLRLEIHRVYDGRITVTLNRRKKTVTDKAYNEDVAEPPQCGLDACDIACLEKYIEKGLSVELKPSSSLPLLSYYVQSGEKQCVEYLLTHKANVNLGDRRGWTPLLHSVYSQNIELTNLLLSSGADINQKSKDGGEAIILAAEIGSKEFIELLIDKGADVNHVTLRGGTPLMFASIRGHTEVVQQLLKNRANPNIVDQGNISPLMHASSNGHVKIVDLLLKNGAKVNLKDFSGYSAIMAPADSSRPTKSHLQIIDALIKAGADINGRNNNGDTALSIAKKRGLTKIIIKLEENGAVE